MPVTFDVATHKARSISIDKNPHKTMGALLKAACYEQWKNSKGVLQTSFTEWSLSRLRPQKNGFVHTVVTAYGGHHNLTIRPDDVWIAILSQLGFYLNKHAEELRNYFVAHEGKKELRLQTVCAWHTVDFGHLATQMSGQIHKNVVDKTLVEWVLPDFTTSTPQDVTICSALMMSTFKENFSRTFVEFTCGIPSVTLEGEKEDWEKLYRRLDRLPELGNEPEQWAAMLRPILHRFMDAFDGNPDITFWEHVVNQDHICEYDMLSGWITAFCVWDVRGKWLASDRNVETATTESMGGSVMTPPHYMLDGVPYFFLDMKDVPVGYNEVDVLVIDNGKKIQCTMVAGHVAFDVSRTTKDGLLVLDTLRPAPQWFLCVKASENRFPGQTVDDLVTWRELELEDSHRAPHTVEPPVSAVGRLRKIRLPIFGDVGLFGLRTKRRARI